MDLLTFILRANLDEIVLKLSDGVHSHDCWVEVAEELLDHCRHILGRRERVLHGGVCDLDGDYLGLGLAGGVEAGHADRAE